jgi:hypothetical protein
LHSSAVESKFYFSILTPCQISTTTHETIDASHIKGADRGVMKLVSSLLTCRWMCPVCFGEVSVSMLQVVVISCGELRTSFQLSPMQHETIDASAIKGGSRGRHEAGGQISTVVVSVWLVSVCIVVDVSLFVLSCHSVCSD